MKRTGACILICLALACTRRPEPGGGVFVVGVSFPLEQGLTTPRTAGFGQVVEQFAREKLFVQDVDGRLQPGLAQSASASGRTWRVTLGDSVTPADVLASFDLAQVPGIAEIAIDGGDVVFTLDEPDASFADSLARVWILPADQVDVVSLVELQGHGPFRPKHWTDHAIVMVPNPDYSPAPKLGGLVIKSVPDNEALWVELVGGSIDYAPYTDNETALDGLADVQRIDRPSAFVSVLRFNCEALPDPRMRRALNLAVHRERAIKRGLTGRARPASSFRSLGDPYDPNAATRLLEGKTHTLEVITPKADGELTEMLQFIRLDLAEVGITLRVVPLDWVEWETRQRSGDFVLAGATLRATPAHLLNVYKEEDVEVADFGNCRTPELVAAIEQVDVDPSPANYQAYFDLLERVSQNEPAALFLWRRERPIYMHARFRGIESGDLLRTALPSLYVPAKDQLERDALDYWSSGS